MKVKMKKIKFIMLIGCMLCLTGCGLSTFQAVAFGSGVYGLSQELERQNENKK